MNVIPPNNNPKAKAKAKERSKPGIRPLSAYNLFFRFKRQQLLHACEEADPDKATVEFIVNCTPGLEFVSKEAVSVLPDEDLEKFRSDRIRAALEDKLTPNQEENSKRVHRKTKFNHGLSFLDMSRLISASWKECDDLSKKVFEGLAEDGRVIVRELAEQEQIKAQEEKEKAEADSLSEDEGEIKRKEEMLAKSFDSVRPNALHKSRQRSEERGASKSKGGRAAEEVDTEHHDNANIYREYLIFDMHVLTTLLILPKF